MNATLRLIESRGPRPEYIAGSLEELPIVGRKLVIVGMLSITTSIIQEVRPINGGWVVKTKNSMYELKIN